MRIRRALQGLREALSAADGDQRAKALPAMYHVRWYATDSLS